MPPFLLTFLLKIDHLSIIISFSSGNRTLNLLQKVSAVLRVSVNFSLLQSRKLLGQISAISASSFVDNLLFLYISSKNSFCLPGRNLSLFCITALPNLLLIS
ncbi:MAG: hypothetical protein A2857_00220 [Candidatus Levybacteria bacterium RIFCSPHIGHO2_01_FULL_36_15]|nr:MAG: hypothetical protein A2857_00220 [Candidatus Levybacteria bacterium RIFCSPHIGHO2_01_FULL_36_15]OGH38935.1 MAG: hypothetical protein A2905_05715 [Candidatus Levybacteria bacterium RIFCSPLOWO2_01_FULL_36_10]